MSARGNALLLESGLPGPGLLRALNGIAPEVYFSAAAEVGPAFRLRAAEERVYRYWEPEEVAGRRAYQQALELVTGRLDVRSFGRGLTAPAPVWREVRDIALVPAPGGSWVQITARSFVWGMVRKMISAVRAHAEGRLDLAALREAVEGRARLTLTLAEPEPLVLWDVRYSVPWTTWATRYSRHQREYWGQEHRAWSARGPVVAALAEGIPESSASRAA